MRQGTSKGATVGFFVFVVVVVFIFFFLLATYFWGMGPILRVVCFPSETPWEKTKFSFAHGFQLNIASGLGIGADIYFSLQL
jgi:Na+-transporting methylmalonyl-CoA/oxaloacetate decarboxylase gamma subunit